MPFTEQHVQLQDSLRRFIEAEINPHVDEWEKAGIFPAHELFGKMGKLGFLGVTKPVEYGGLGLDYSFSVAMTEALGSIHFNRAGAVSLWIAMDFHSDRWSRTADNRRMLQFMPDDEERQNLVRGRIGGSLEFTVSRRLNVWALFEGALGQSSRGNGEPLRVSDTAELRMANVHTGADKNAAPDSAPFRFFHRIATLVQRPRIYGAAALDICLVASGAADAFFEPGLYLWDIAAADLILRQAGGAGSLLREGPGHRLAYLGSNGRIHAALRSALEPLFEPAAPARPASERTA